LPFSFSFETKKKIGPILYTIVDSIFSIKRFFLFSIPSHSLFEIEDMSHVNGAPMGKHEADKRARMTPLSRRLEELKHVVRSDVPDKHRASPDQSTEYPPNNKDVRSERHTQRMTEISALLHAVQEHPFTYSPHKRPADADEVKEENDENAAFVAPGGKMYNVLDALFELMCDSLPDDNGQAAAFRTLYTNVQLAVNAVKHVHASNPESALYRGSKRNMFAEKLRIVDQQLYAAQDALSRFVQRSIDTMTWDEKKASLLTRARGMCPTEWTSSMASNATKEAVRQAVNDVANDDFMVQTVFGVPVPTVEQQHDASYMEKLNDTIEATEHWIAAHLLGIDPRRFVCVGDTDDEWGHGTPVNDPPDAFDKQFKQHYPDLVTDRDTMCDFFTVEQEKRQAEQLYDLMRTTQRYVWTARRPLYTITEDDMEHDEFSPPSSMAGQPPGSITNNRFTNHRIVRGLGWLVSASVRYVFRASPYAAVAVMYGLGQETAIFMNPGHVDFLTAYIPQAISQVASQLTLRSNLFRARQYSTLTGLTLNAMLVLSSPQHSASATYDLMSSAVAISAVHCLHDNIIASYTPFGSDDVAGRSIMNSIHVVTDPLGYTLHQFEPTFQSIFAQTQVGKNDYLISNTTNEATHLDIQAGREGLRLAMEARVYSRNRTRGNGDATTTTTANNTQYEKTEVVHMPTLLSSHVRPRETAAQLLATGLAMTDTILGHYDNLIVDYDQYDSNTPTYVKQLLANKIAKINELLFTAKAIDVSTLLRRTPDRTEIDTALRSIVKHYNGNTTTTDNVDELDQLFNSATDLANRLRDKSRLPTSASAQIMIEPLRLPSQEVQSNVQLNTHIWQRTVATQQEFWRLAAFDMMTVYSKSYDPFDFITPDMVHMYRRFVGTTTDYYFAPTAAATEVGLVTGIDAVMDSTNQTCWERKVEYGDRLVLTRAGVDLLTFEFLLASDRAKLIQLHVDGLPPHSPRRNQAFLEPLLMFFQVAFRFDPAFHARVLDDVAYAAFSNQYSPSVIVNESLNVMPNTTDFAEPTDVDQRFNRLLNEHVTGRVTIASIDSQNLALLAALLLRLLPRLNRTRVMTFMQEALRTFLAALLSGATRITRMSSGDRCRLAALFRALNRWTTSRPHADSATFWLRTGILLTQSISSLTILLLTSSMLWRTLTHCAYGPSFSFKRFLFNTTASHTILTACYYISHGVRHTRILRNLNEKAHAFMHQVMPTYETGRWTMPHITNAFYRVQEKTMRDIHDYMAWDANGRLPSAVTSSIRRINENVRNGTTLESNPGIKAIQTMASPMWFAFLNVHIAHSTRAVDAWKFWGELTNNLLFILRAYRKLSVVTDNGRRSSRDAVWQLATKTCKDVLTYACANEPHLRMGMPVDENRSVQMNDDAIRRHYMHVIQFGTMWRANYASQDDCALHYRIDPGIPGRNYDPGMSGRNYEIAQLSHVSFVPDALLYLSIWLENTLLRCPGVLDMDLAFVGVIVRHIYWYANDHIDTFVTERVCTNFLLARLTDMKDRHRRKQTISHAIELGVSSTWDSLFAYLFGSHWLNDTIDMHMRDTLQQINVHGEKINSESFVPRTILGQASETFGSMFHQFTTALGVDTLTNSVQTMLGGTGQSVLDVMGTKLAQWGINLGTYLVHFSAMMTTLGLGETARALVRWARGAEHSAHTEGIMRRMYNQVRGGMWSSCTTSLWESTRTSHFSNVAGTAVVVAWRAACQGQATLSLFFFTYFGRPDSNNDNARATDIFIDDAISIGNHLFTGLSACVARYIDDSIAKHIVYGIESSPHINECRFGSDVREDGGEEDEEQEKEDENEREGVPDSPVVPRRSGRLRRYDS